MAEQEYKSLLKESATNTGLLAKKTQLFSKLTIIALCLLSFSIALYPLFVILDGNGILFAIFSFVFIFGNIIFFIISFVFFIKSFYKFKLEFSKIKSYLEAWNYATHLELFQDVRIGKLYAKINEYGSFIKLILMFVFFAVWVERNFKPISKEINEIVD